MVDANNRDPELERLVEDFKARQRQRGRGIPIEGLPSFATKASSYTLVICFLLLAAGIFLYGFHCGLDRGGFLIGCVGLLPMASALLLLRGIRKEKDKKNSA